MEIKYTVQGLLIYATIAAYLLAFVTTLARRPRAGQMLFFAGFILATVSFIYRWVHVEHVPLQNLFEVFLFLGVACYPISWFSRRFLQVGCQSFDMLIGAIVLFPAGFVFNAEPMQLPPALQSWLFGPHVAVYMTSYMVLAKSAFAALIELTSRTKRPSVLLGMIGGLVGAAVGGRLGGITWGFLQEGLTWGLHGALIGILQGAILGVLIKANRGENALEPEQATYRMASVGFPLLTLGLILGSWWGKLAWGRSWGWDPKELWSLASWLIYVGYFHWRYMFGTRRPRWNSVWAVAGMVAIIITLLWVNLSKIFSGLHSYAS
jgi:cytochrome c-type biogenesis protein CcsB